jgi:hypothetical protein
MYVTPQVLGPGHRALGALAPAPNTPRHQPPPEQRAHRVRKQTCPIKTIMGVKRSQ